MQMDVHSFSGHLYDYFLVSGLSQEDPLSCDVKSDAENTDTFFRPSLIWRFPNDRKENPWNESTLDTFLQLCHPNNVLVTDEPPTNQPSFHTFLSTKDDGFRFYGHVLTYFEKKDCKHTKDELKNLSLTGLSINKDDCLYMQKCICLVSQLPYINTSEKILRALHKHFSSEGTYREPSLCVDFYIYNLLFEVVVPSPGQSIALKWDRCDTIVVQRPGITELPLLDVHLSTVFGLLDGPGNVLKLLTSAFLEHQILLVSEDCHKLILVGEAITSLMFPFKWGHTYVPVLPFKLASMFLDAPVPYIMGIPLRSSDKKLTRIGSEFNQCFVDIDNGIVECPEDQPAFPDQITLLRQIAEIYKTFQRSKEQNKMEPLIEDSVLEEDEEPSPQMRRRNAKKSNRKRNDDKLSEDLVAEELRNLHAVSKPDTVDLKSLRSDQKDISQDLFNAKVREVIFGTLVSLLSQYDKFVIHPESEGHDSWRYARDSQNFDKASFLSDQREAHLTFLSQFLETQAFASLVDGCIMGNVGDDGKGHAQSLLDVRIKEAKRMPNCEKSPDILTKGNPSLQASELLRSVSTISAGRSAKKSIDTWVKAAESFMKARHLNVNGRYPVVKPKNEQGIYTGSSEDASDSFPKINNPSLLCESIYEYVNEAYKSPTPKERPKAMRQPSVSEFTPEIVAQTNWNFLEKLLKDVKSKTNKLVVCKLGQDAYKLGHSHISLLGLEENTLIGSLCDLLERIWCHGLNSNQKKGKSALWSHLCRYQEDSVRIVSFSDARAIDVLQNPSIVSPSQADQAEKSDAQGKGERYCFPPVKVDLLNSIKRIQNLSEVKTSIGKCRAWIRLALEQKQLQAHLKKLLLNRPLLQIIYKRYSLLRCDDETEQFLYHLLALNTVDFSCFSNSFTKTIINYRVWIFPKRQLSGISQTTANVYIKISGELSCTGMISVPKNCTEFSFAYQNLGVLTTALFGHDNSGLLPRWHVDYIIIRNELTGQAFYFPCGRWFGRSIDDGSSQRLLVAYTIPLTRDLNTFLHDLSHGIVSKQEQTIPRDINADQVRDLVGQCVNDIVQHITKNSHSPSCAGVLTTLLFKPNGLIALMTTLFHHGLKSSGMFRKRYFAWDVLQMVYENLSGKVQDTSYKSMVINIMYNTPNSSPRRQPGANARDEGSLLCAGEEDGALKLQNITSDDYLLQAFDTVNAGSCQGLGKEDMFQLLICAGFKKHILADWLQRASLSLQQSALYEKNAFILNKEVIGGICGILKSISDTPINFEQIVWRGFDSLSKLWLKKWFHQQTHLIPTCASWPYSVTMMHLTLLPLRSHALVLEPPRSTFAVLHDRADGFFSVDIDCLKFWLRSFPWVFTQPSVRHILDKLLDGTLSVAIINKIETIKLLAEKCRQFVSFFNSTLNPFNTLTLDCIKQI